MFEFVRKHTRLLQFILVVLIFPSFVFFGVQGYSSLQEGGREVVARVGDYEITREQWDAAHRSQIERMRGQMPDLDISAFDTPAFRRATLDGLIRQYVMLSAVNDQHLVTTDARLQHLFRTDPDLAFLRNPDGSVNAGLLQAQGMSSEQFAERLRQDLSAAQVMEGIEAGAQAPAAAASAAIGAYFQQREVQVQAFRTDDYLKEQKADDAEIEAYYKDPAHAAQYRAPEQAEIEYAVLDIEAINKGYEPGEEDLRKFYEQNAARFSSPDERRARHILIKVDEGASADERSAAKAKAEALLPQAQAADDAGFAALAEKESQDPGSAGRGGDLEWFGRDAMTKPFDDAAFALKVGETSGVVSSDFGYHIIRVTGVRGGERRDFASVRGEIEREARLQEAQRRYAEAAEQFTNLAYEQPDSLQPAAEAAGLSLQKATVGRQAAAGAQGVLANRKLLEAVFDDASINGKRNTEAIETGPSQLVAARVLTHTPAHARPLDEVRDQVRNSVLRAKASETARKAGVARVALGRSDPSMTLGASNLTVSRAQAHELPSSVLEAVLQVDPASLPAWIGVDLADAGYLVARVARVAGLDPQVVAEGDAVRQQYAQAWTQAEVQSYYSVLKDRYKVEITDAALAPAAADTP